MTEPVLLLGKSSIMAQNLALN
jgi:hypothetical protein